MPSTYSSNLKIELMSTGENSGTWGNITNTNLGTALEQAIVGYGAVNYVSDANLTISITNTNAAQAARALVLNVTSSLSLTGTRELVVPTIEKQYIVQNNTTGSQSITVKTSAGTGITVPNGRKAHLYVDGTNVIQMFDFVDINGGTIDGTAIGGSSAAAGAFTSLTASGATTLNGAVALGDASGDLITVPGTINSNLLFTDNSFDIGASGANRPRNLFLAGAATVGGNLSVGGTLTLTGGLILNGNVTVGDSSADTLTVNATITSNLLFTDNTYDIGASGATRPRNLFLAGNATIGGDVTTAGRVIVDDTTDSTSATTGSIQTDGGLGVAKALFVGTTVTINGGTANGVAYLNGSKVLTTGSTLVFDGTTLGVGATPSPWVASVAGIDLRNYGGVSSDSSYAYLSSNIYYDGANKRKALGGVGLLGVGNGGSGLFMHYQVAGSGAANSTISLSTAFAVDTSSRFGINTTSMGAPLSFADVAGDKIQFNGANSNQYKISLHSGSGSTDAIYRFTAGTVGEAGSGAGDFQFYTGPTQKFGINSKGAVCIGPTLAAWGSSIGVLEFSGASRNQGYIAFTAGANPKGYIYSNLYYDGTNNRYVNTGSASVYEIDPTYYQWWFVGSGSAGNTASLVGKARLNASGYLGLNGQLNPRVPLQLGSSSGQMLAVYDDNNATPTRVGLGIDLTGGTYELASFIGAPSSPNGLWTFANWNATSNTYTRVAMINQNGIGLSTENPASGVGIKFPASQSASSNANTLDDYEEGDWTPRLSGTSGGDYTPSGINQGRYVKIGRVVYATCQLQWSAVVTPYAGNLIVSGLPFSNNTTRSSGSMGAVDYGLNFTSGYGEWNYLIDPGYSYVYVIQNSTNGAGYSHAPTVGATGRVYAMTIVYEATN